MTEMGRVLRERLKQGLLVIPGAHDVASAVMVEKVGFEAVLLGSYAVSISQLGIPDLGLISDQDMLRTTRAVVERVSIPVVADVDTGYGGGGLGNVVRTVKMFEHAGAACIQMEDQVSPKRAGMTEGRRVIPVEEMVAKIRAAVEHRADENFLIMARTDVQPFAAAIERGKAYEAAGADIVYIEDYTRAQDVDDAAKAIGVPTVYTMAEGAPMPWIGLDELAKRGAGILYYPITTLAASVKASERSLRVLKEFGTTASIMDDLTPFSELAALVDDQWWRDIGRAK